MTTVDRAIAQQVAALLESGCVLIDLETTGLSDDPGVAIVEIGLIDQDGVVLLDTLVNPQRPIPPAASAVHGITDQDVAGAPTFEQVHAQLTACLAGQNAVAYNVDFELAILESVCRRLDLALPVPHAWFCAMRLYAAYRRSARFFRLGAACKSERIVVSNAHRALGDCSLTLALLRTMAKKA